MYIYREREREGTLNSTVSICLHIPFPDTINFAASMSSSTRGSSSWVTVCHGARPKKSTRGT